jgi:preprotein translocase subunit SecF
MILFRDTKIDFISKKRVAWILSILVILCGIFSLISSNGPNLSIDFTGGTVIQVKFKNEKNIGTIRALLEDNNISASEIITFGSPNEILITIQSSSYSNEELTPLFMRLFNNDVEIRRIESVGPKIGKELRADAISAIAIALLLITIYIGFRFDRFYAIGSIVAIVHDVMILLGIFSLLAIKIDLTVIAAFLTVVGYSLNDTIVVFDRIRENITKDTKSSLKTIVNSSINNTLSRTVVTSFTTLVVVTSLFLFGGEVINNFAFALILGVLVGTYSSIFIASPVMMYFEKTEN